MPEQANRQACLKTCSPSCNMARVWDRSKSRAVGREHESMGEAEARQTALINLVHDKLSTFNCTQVGCSQPTLSRKFLRGRFSQSEREEIFVLCLYWISADACPLLFPKQSLAGILWALYCIKYYKQAREVLKYMRECEREPGKHHVIVQRRLDHWWVVTPSGGPGPTSPQIPKKNWIH